MKLLKKLFFLIIHFIFSSNLILGQTTPPVEFYDSTVNSTFIESVQDDSSIVLLTTLSNSSETKGFSIIKFDYNFNLIWRRNYFTSYYANPSVAYDIEKCSDNGFVITGKSYGTSNLNIDSLLLMKIDFTGNVLWVKSFFTNGLQYSLHGIKSFEDSLKNIVTYGTIRKKLLNQSDNIIFKLVTDSIGNLLYSKSFKGNAADIVSYEDWDFRSTYDGGIAFKIWQNHQSFTICEISKYEQIKYSEKSYNIFGYGSAILKTLENEYLLAGNLNTFQTEGILVSKVDSSGKEKWAYQYYCDKNLQIRQIKFLPNLDILISGLSYLDINGNKSEAFIARIDSSGNIIWSRNYLLNNDQKIYNLIYDCFQYDNQILSLGLTDATNSQFFRFNLFSMDQSGITNCTNNELLLQKSPYMSQPNAISIQPDTIILRETTGFVYEITSSFNVLQKCYAPIESTISNQIPTISNSIFSSNFEINFNNAPEINYQYFLFDVNARLIKTGFSKEISNTINCDEINSGLYILSIVTEKETSNFKLIKI